MSAVIPGIPPRWSKEEIKVASNLHEQAIEPLQIADVLKAMFGTQRTIQSINAMMRKERVRFGAGVEPDVLELKHPEYFRAQQRGRLGGIARAIMLEDADRPQPWHPARDPKPAFLQRRQP